MRIPDADVIIMRDLQEQVTPAATIITSHHICSLAYKKLQFE